MKTIIFSILFSLMFLTPMSKLSLAAEPVCAIGNETEFREEIKTLKAEFLIAKPVALEKALALVNKNRANSGKHLIQADRLILGVFVNPSKNALMVGYAFFKDGCLVPGAVGAMPAVIFADFVSQAKIDFEKDFIEERSS